MMFFDVIAPAESPQLSAHTYTGIYGGSAGCNITIGNKKILIPAGKTIHTPISTISGGIDRSGRVLDTRTEKQNEILESSYLLLKNKFPSLTFHGHNEFSNKACPSFNVKKWLESIDNNN